MARIEKTVFISYRRTDVYTALAVYENLKNQGYDVFFDYRSISSGDFEQIITSNIRARAHFLLILTPTALDRCNEPGDWLRREIEIALDEQRNIVPLFFKGFRFGIPSVTKKLTGKLKNLSRYNGLNVHEDYFDEAMHRLHTQYLNVPMETILHPVSTEVQKVVRAEQVAADKALEQIENVKGLVGQREEELGQNIELPKPVAAQNAKSKNANGISTVPRQTVVGLTGGLLLIVLLIWGGVNLLRNQSLANLKPTATNTRPPVSTPTPAQTSVLPIRTYTPTPTFSITPTGTDAIPVTLTAKSTASCYGLSYMGDITIPDDTPMRVGQTFTKTWRVKNSGSCAWDAGFKFAFVGGDSMGGSTYILPVSVAAGALYDISIAMTAPNRTGTIRGNWRMSTANGQFFGDEMYVQIVVSSQTSATPGAPSLGIGSTMISDQDGMTLLYVPAGDFTMGSDMGDSDEKPVHIVHLNAFWIDKTEVTNAMYVKCVQAGKCNQHLSNGSQTRENYYGISGFKDYPVIYVSWNDAKTYCAWAERRLPTESEWEKAARGDDDKHIYPWGKEAPNDNLLNYNSTIGDTTEVGEYPGGASPYGALDMAGNVGEWVADWYSDTYYGSSPPTNPLGPNLGQFRVYRGGAWDASDRYARSAERGAVDPASSVNYFGFRCALSVTP